MTLSGTSAMAVSPTAKPSFVPAPLQQEGKDEIWCSRPGQLQTRQHKYWAPGPSGEHAGPPGAFAKLGPRVWQQPNKPEFLAKHSRPVVNKTKTKFRPIDHFGQIQLIFLWGKISQLIFLWGKNKLQLIFLWGKISYLSN
jgi:hypothetical protein